jgi:hypothetical protein
MVRHSSTRTPELQDRADEITRLREQVLRQQGGIGYWARQHRAAREEAEYLPRELAATQAGRSGTTGQATAWCTVAGCSHLYDPHQHLDAYLTTEAGLAARPAAIVASAVRPLASASGKSQ